MNSPAKPGMLLELGKFASFLLSVLCLCALFYTAFLLPANTFEDRALSLLPILILTSGASWVSGWLFYCDERRAGCASSGVATTFPMMVFWWTAAIILGLFLFAWFLQVYFLPPFGVLRH